jgi:hypothetical protein
VTSSAGSAGLTEQEAKLYDRQLRVWGVEAQHRMRTASVLLAGHVNGFAAEIAKNIILAGVGSVTLSDPSPVVPANLAGSFCLHPDDVGRPRDAAAAARLQELNPNVVVTAASTSPSAVAGGRGVFASVAAAPASFWRSYDVVILLGATLRDALTVSAHCRTDADTAAASAATAGVRVAPSTSFLYGGFFGESAFWFQDLGKFDYVSALKTVKAEVKERVPATVAYDPLPAVVARLVAAESAALFTAPAGAVAVSAAADGEGASALASACWEASAAGALRAAAGTWLPSLRGALRFEKRRAALLLGMLAAAAAASDADLTAARTAADAAVAADAAARIPAPAGGDGREGVSVSELIALRNVEVVSDAAVVGGLVAQEVLKSMARQAEPLVNTAVYDGDANKVMVFAL